MEGGAAVRRALGREDGALVLAGRPVPAGAGLRVIAAGKAAVPMARALEERAGERIVEGLVVTKEGHGAPLARCTLREAGHPVPDARSAEAGRAALALAARTAPDEVLVVLLSGGASALLSAPLPGLTLAELAALTEALLRAGAPIDELNTVRKHLTAVSGGRLARASRAQRTCVLAISDVPGDAPELLASGPCAADPSRFADALAVLEARGLGRSVPPAVWAALREGAAGRREESVAPGDPALARVDTSWLATLDDALGAVRGAARERGLHAVPLPGRVEGEARVAGRRLVALGRALRSPGGVGAVVLVGGGETTVTVRGPGRGGRCQELALSAALALEVRRGIALLAAGTDGTDGPTEAAGAYADGGTAARGRARGIDPQAALDRNDAHAFFAAEGGLVVTGPTGTNVTDLYLVRVGDAGGGG